MPSTPTGTLTSEEGNSPSPTENVGSPVSQATHDRLEQLRRQGKRIRTSSLSRFGYRLRGISGIKESDRQFLTDELHRRFESDFLDCDRFFAEYCQPYLQEDEYKQHKVRFVKAWIARNCPSGQSGEPSAITSEQALAISCLAQNVQVIARAGSGKTAVIVLRTYFLLKHCKVDPSQILVLAFNRNAALEVRKRIFCLLAGRADLELEWPLALEYGDEGDRAYGTRGSYDEKHEVINEASIEARIRLPHVLTFDALAHRIVRPKEKLLANDRKLAKSNPFHKLVHELIEDCLEDPKLRKTIDFLMLTHYRYQQDYNLADFLREAENCERIYPPPRMVTPAMRQMLRKYYEKRDVKYYPMEEEEEIYAVQERIVPLFIRTVEQFITRCRQKALSESELDELFLESHRDLPQMVFFRIGRAVYSAYLKRLEEKHEFDFPGLMGRAADRIRSGFTGFHGMLESGELSNLRYISIDEFQDFSQRFHSLISTIRNRNPSVAIFCVGDDWQAINGFAGSELRFFEEFKKYIGTGSTLHLTTNHRSASKIVKVGNHVMRGKGVAVKPAPDSEEGEVLFVDVGTFWPKRTPWEIKRFDNDLYFPALLRVISDLIRRDLDITILSRTHHLSSKMQLCMGNPFSGLDLQSFLRHIQSFFPNGGHKISITTVHPFKGMENSAVIVLDALRFRYPLMHPDRVFFEMFGEDDKSIVEDERRLFYVALSRARQSLVIFTRSAQWSPFIEGLKGWGLAEEINWNRLPEVPHPSSYRMEIRTIKSMNRGGSYAIRDLLREEDWSWAYRPHKFWLKIADKSEFSIGHLMMEKWAREADGVLLRVLDASHAVVHCYEIVEGKWTRAKADRRWER